MGKSIMIIAFAALLIFVTLTQSAPPRSQKMLTPGECLGLIDKAQLGLEKKMPLVKKRTEDESSYRSITNRDLLGANARTRFDTLRSPKEYFPGCSYEQLLELASTDSSWRPVCLAHEHLIVARAQHDMKRLKEHLEYYTSRQDVTANKIGETRLKAYKDFISHHEWNIYFFLYGPGGSLDPMEVLTMYIAKLRQELQALVGTGETPEPMATSTNYVDRPTLDLLSQHRAYDSDAPPSGTSDRINRPVFDFLGQAAEQELGISLGTPYPEGYEAPTLLPGDLSLALPPNHRHAAESSTHSHDNRNRGKMPMYDDSYQDHYYYGPGDGYHRR
ncbi:hypothetical protein SeLEV6574_g08418 [Synchytrium endobioticum]|uniref:Uncharacterized protein n=1 Tax=Synchytrium endobioticum TaxID=286115 RepID=A0A507BW31_9FUNG|nr:hypothetical protein SeLEV6574_g08418 [Synchytrium endobioticum]